MLVIEPNRAYLAVIARRLAEFGFRIATARTAHDGLAELHRVPVDLMLSELRLPATSGIELGEMRIRWERSEAERRRLTLIGRNAA